MSDKPATQKFWTDVCAVALTVAVYIVLFYGTPDISDALRVKACQWAGLECKP